MITENEKCNAFKVKKRSFNAEPKVKEKIFIKKVHIYTMILQTRSILNQFFIRQRLNSIVLDKDSIQFNCIRLC